MKHLAALMLCAASVAWAEPPKISVSYSREIVAAPGKVLEVDAEIVDGATVEFSPGDWIDLTSDGTTDATASDWSIKPDKTSVGFRAFRQSADGKACSFRSIPGASYLVRVNAWNETHRAELEFRIVVSGSGPAPNPVPGPTPIPGPTPVPGPQPNGFEGKIKEATLLLGPRGKATAKDVGQVYESIAAEAAASPQGTWNAAKMFSTANTQQLTKLELTDLPDWRAYWNAQTDAVFAEKLDSRDLAGHIELFHAIARQLKAVTP